MHEYVFLGDSDGIRRALAEGAEVEALDRESRTPLINAAIDNRLECAETLLAAGADVNAQDRRGNSALHCAAQNWHPRMVALLIENGAVVDLEDTYGNTPLARAVFESKGREEVVRILLSAGADKDHKNKHGQSPYGLAQIVANYDLKKLFKGFEN